MFLYFIQNDLGDKNEVSTDFTKVKGGEGRRGTNQSRLSSNDQAVSGNYY